MSKPILHDRDSAGANTAERVFLCTQSLYGSRPASVGWTTIDARGWVEGETPVEDFGMWFTTDREVSPQGAGRIFTALLARNEGEEPLKGHMSEQDRLFRSHLLPVLLEPDEFDIYQSLTQNG